MEQFFERPATAGLSEKELSAYDFLDALGVGYVGVHHPPAMTMEDCVAIDAALGASMCKNLFLCNRQQTEFYLLMMPGDKPFRTKHLSAALGVARLSFATHEKMEELLGVAPGSATVLALAADKDGAVQLLIDEELLKAPYIGAHPLVNTASVRLATTDILNVILPATGHTPRVVSLPREEIENA